MSYMFKARGTPAQQAEAQREEAQLRALAKIRRKQQRRQLQEIALGKTLPAPKGGRKCGPKPNPFLDKCSKGWHSQLTEGEHAALDAARLAETPVVTRSAFLRRIIQDHLLDRAGTPAPLVAMVVAERQQGAAFRRAGHPRRIAA
jgi:hypothetical protein